MLFSIIGIIFIWVWNGLPLWTNIVITFLFALKIIQRAIVFAATIIKSQMD